MRTFSAVLFFLCGASLHAAPATCESLATAKLPHTEIRSAAVVPAGKSASTLPELPALCRVAGLIRPSADSEIQFEVWMPGANWNGKFLGVGNGGFAGSINVAGMAAAVARGYATASTDTGHSITGGASWALKHPEKIVDFGYRAIHETAEKAKALIREFYGAAPRRSYFDACSNGGRQALMEAQRFPADYDGILAGAPANFWTRLLTAAAWDMRATLAEPGAYIAAAKLPAIQSAVVAACDSLDGAKDAMLQNPAQCRFDPAVLLCSGAETDSCLTQPQVGALKKIYSGPQNKNGETMFPGYAPGGEAEPGGWGPWITGQAREKSLMYGFASEFFKNMVYDDPAWDVLQFDVDRDGKAADAKLARVLNATDPDLSRFRGRGGKLILYHGWSDAAIPAQNAIDYYQSVVAKMGQGKVDSFLRLFLAPGVQHCGGGSGPNVFGQAIQARQGDPATDISAALEQWVEKGIAPEQVIATRYKTGTDPASGIVRTRPLCAYPKVAIWNGSGSMDEASSFTCGMPAAAKTVK